MIFHKSKRKQKSLSHNQIVFLCIRVGIHYDVQFIVFLIVCFMFCVPIAAGVC